jgi:hypothetical protein
MRREETKPEDLQRTSWATIGTVRAKSGTGRYTALLRTPACATEQIEHSWLGSLEFSVCTWTAWTMPVKVTSRIHNKDRAAMSVSLRDLYPDEIKRNAPLQSCLWVYHELVVRCTPVAIELPCRKVTAQRVPVGAWFGRG